MNAQIAHGLRYVEVFLFVVIASATIARWLRQRDPANGWLAATFAVLATASGGAGLLPVEAHATWTRLAVKAFVCLLLLFPYCLYRFAATFKAPPRTVRVGVHALVGAGVASTLALSRFPPPGSPRSDTFTAYLVLIVAEWLLLTAVVVYHLVHAGRTLPMVARRRTQLLAAGAVLLSVGVIRRAASPTRTASVWLTISVELLAILSAVLFLVGFAPPGLLLQIWRRGDDWAFQGAALALIQANTPDEVIDDLLPRLVTLVGAEGAALVDPHGQVLGQSGSTRGTDPVQVSLPQGRLDIWTNAYTPFFDSQQLELLRSLGSLLYLTLERTLIFEREVRSAAELADAQRIAQLGSWRCASDSSPTWSEEMYRIYELTPRNDNPADPLHLERVHPEDRSRVAAQLERTATERLPLDVEYRIVVADGTVRWLHCRGRASVEGQPPITVLQGTCQDITARRDLTDELAWRAGHDPLTGLPNRTLLVTRLAAALERSRSRARGLAVLFIDVDRFKLINDSLGHLAGDEVLLTVAGRLDAVRRAGDTVARFGGDEFIVLCDGLRDQDDALAAAERFQQVLSKPIGVPGSELVVTASIGIAMSSGDDGPGALLRDADAAMYQAKAAGRARSVLFVDAHRVQATERLNTEMELRRALSAGEMRVHYQPIINLSSRQLAGMEALVRWQHPTRGLVPPGEFIAVAEETGLIVPLGEWVLEQACAQLAAWQHGYPQHRGLRMAVNISPVQLSRPGLPDQVARILARSGVDAVSLELEITESVLLQNSPATLTVLRTIKDMGVRLSVDDFGTGYSSLGSLKHFPVDVLKIDRSFVDGLGSDPGDVAIVRAIVALASALGMSTIAEGIESVRQLDALVELGCDLAQGYLFSRPQPAAELEAVLARGHRRPFSVPSPREGAAAWRDGSALRAGHG